MIICLTRRITAIIEILALACQVKGTVNESTDARNSDTAADLVTTSNKRSESLVVLENSVSTPPSNSLDSYVNIEEKEKASGGTHSNTSVECKFNRLSLSTLEPDTSYSYKMKNDDSSSCGTQTDMSKLVENLKKIYEIGCRISSEVQIFVKIAELDPEFIDEPTLVDYVYPFLVGSSSGPLEALDQLDIPGFIMSLMSKPLPNLNTFLGLLNDWIPYSSTRNYVPEDLKGIKLLPSNLLYKMEADILMRVICYPLLQSSVDKTGNMSTKFPDIKTFRLLKSGSEFRSCLKHLIKNVVSQKEKYVLGMLGFYSDFAKALQMIIFIMFKIHPVVDPDFPYASNIINIHVINSTFKILVDAHLSVGSHLKLLGNFMDAACKEVEKHVGRLVQHSIDHKEFIIFICSMYLIEISQNFQLCKLFDAPNGNIILSIMENCRKYSMFNPEKYNTNEKNNALMLFSNVSSSIKATRYMWNFQKKLYDVLRSGENEFEKNFKAMLD